MDQNKPYQPGDQAGKSGGSQGPSKNQGWSPTSQPGPAAGASSVSTGLGLPPLTGPGAETNRGSDRRLDHSSSNNNSSGSGLGGAGAVVNDLRHRAMDQGAHVLGDVQHRAEGALEQGKSRIAHQIDSVGNVIDEMAGKISEENEVAGRYARMAADQVTGLAEYLRNTEPRDMARGIESFARRRPEVFIGGAVIAGLLIGRFFRSHEPRSQYDTGGRGGFDSDRDQFRAQGLSGTGGGLGSSTYGPRGQGIDSSGIGSSGMSGIGAASSGIGTTGSSGPGGAGATGYGSTGSSFNSRPEQSGGATGSGATGFGGTGSSGASNPSAFNKGAAGTRGGTGSSSTGSTGQGPSANKNDQNKSGGQGPSCSL